MTASTPPPDDPRARLLVGFAAGQEIFREGRPGAEMFIIEDGEVEISRLHGASEKHLSTLGPGDFFGEMALLEDRPRSATARARTDCKLLPIDASTFDQLLRDNPEIAIRMMRKLAVRLKQTTELLEQSVGHEVSIEESSVRQAPASKKETIGLPRGPRLKSRSPSC